MPGTATLKITKYKWENLVEDPALAANAVNLVYVSTAAEGISRLKCGKGFRYIFKSKPLKDEVHLKRIHSLVIPPAWRKVWICHLENGHLQVVGIDTKNRKQYKYHSRWNELRNQTKFYRLLRFAGVLPKIRRRLEKDLKKDGLPLEKVMALIVSLMEQTHIRVGNNEYEKLYGSFGLTTLKDKHIAVNGPQLKFSFKGKKGVHHDIDLHSKKLARLVQQCKEIPGKELFQYYDDKNERHPVDSGMVNDYIRGISGKDFTAKDFRTWAGTMHAFLALKETGLADTDTAAKKNIIAALDKVAARLGNSRTICKKYYVHPKVISLYESKNIKPYFDELDKTEKDDDNPGLTKEEKVIMKLLKDGH